MAMDENFILPFQLESSNIRGRIVRLSSVLDDILEAHDYPHDVSKHTGEMVLLCALLSSMLKFDGIFTLQIQSDGNIRMLVADMVTGGYIRACATFDEDKFTNGDLNKSSSGLGNGHMAFTVDQGEHTERYQGIVDLKPSGIVESVQHYFSQSEQIATGIMACVGQVNGKWRGGAVMLQQMPEDSFSYNQDKDPAHEDDWRRAMVLLGSLKNEELLSSDLQSEDVIYRLFHEEGIRVFEPQPLQKRCRCSVEKTKSILLTMSEEDLNDIAKDGKIDMMCEFCSTNYSINVDEIYEKVTP
jgi:molecular chaperone Hsp33